MKKKKLRSKDWFDNPKDPGLTALYLERYLNDLEIKGTDKKYIPHCSTWLSQKRFLDYEDYQMQEIKTPEEKKSSNNNWYDELVI